MKKPVLSFYHFSEKDIARFWSKVRMAGPKECWLWTGSGNAYGIFPVSRDGKATNIMAHKAAYILSAGHTGDWLVCHMCDEPRCVNPAHLFLGTHLDNMRDMVRKGRSLAGSASPRAKVTNEQVRALILRFRAGVPRGWQKKKSLELGLSRNQIGRLLNQSGVWEHIIVDPVAVIKFDDGFESEIGDLPPAPEATESAAWQP